MKKLFNLWWKIKSKNLTCIPLFVMTFDYQKFKKYGKKGSCVFHTVHPDLFKDEFLKEKLTECVDHIREKYDLEIFAGINL